MTTTNQGREGEDAPETEAFRKFFKKVQPPQFMDHSSWLNGVAIGWQGAMAEARSTPPAVEAGEMRERCARVCRARSNRTGAVAGSAAEKVMLALNAEADACARAIEALPAPTVEAGEGEVARLKAERDAAVAESAAVVCAIQEISIGAGLPSVIIGRIRDENGVEKDWAIRPEQIRNLTAAIKKRIEECAPFGLGAVKSHQENDYLHAKIRQLEKEVLAHLKAHDAGKGDKGGNDAR